MTASQRPTIVVVGSSNTDLVIGCDKLPSPGQTVLGGEFARHAGGKGANQAVAAARAGVNVVFVGARGDDDFGEAAAARLAEAGVDITHFSIQAAAPSGIALILVGGRSKENIIAVARSANDLVTAESVAAAEAEIAAASVVLAQLEVPLGAVCAAADLAARHGVPCVLNPAPYRDLPPDLQAHVGIMTPHEIEATQLAGVATPEEAAHVILDSDCECVMVTMGARGVLIADKNGNRLVPAPQVDPVDTVGAGDCFTAWVAAGVAEGMDAAASAARACAAAAIAVTRPGAQSGMPTREEVLSSPIPAVPAPQ